MANNVRYVLIETCERESVMLGSYATKKEAQQDMLNAIHDHMLTACSLNDYEEDEIKEVYDEMKDALDNGEPEEWDTSFGISPNNAWSNAVDGSLMDWNIFEVPFN